MQINFCVVIYYHFKIDKKKSTCLKIPGQCCQGHSLNLHQLHNTQWSAEDFKITDSVWKGVAL